MSEPSYRYNAFISYRHVEPDRDYAKWLHKALETYKVPKELQKKGCPARIQRIFRDEEELPVSSDLSNEINIALEQSEFLIVVCSPRIIESVWCNAEVQKFRNLGRHNKILALLIEGEPSESFPPALCEIRHEVSKGGQRIEEIERVEPLAADVRLTRHESQKFLKEMAKIRFLACLLGCRFDDLRQREQLRRQRRFYQLMALLIALLVAFASLTAWAIAEMNLANTLKEKSLKLQEQAETRLYQLQQGSGFRHLNEGKIEEGLLYLANSLEHNPNGTSSKDRLFFELSTRNWLIPVRSVDCPPEIANASEIKTSLDRHFLYYHYGRFPKDADLQQPALDYTAGVYTFNLQNVKNESWQKTLSATYKNSYSEGYDADLANAIILDNGLTITQENQDTPGGYEEITISKEDKPLSFKDQDGTALQLFGLPTVSPDQKTLAVIGLADSRSHEALDHFITGNQLHIHLFDIKTMTMTGDFSLHFQENNFVKTVEWTGDHLMIQSSTPDRLGDRIDIIEVENSSGEWFFNSIFTNKAILGEIVDYIPEKRLFITFQDQKLIFYKALLSKKTFQQISSNGKRIPKQELKMFFGNSEIDKDSLSDDQIVIRNRQNGEEIKRLYMHLNPGSFLEEALYLPGGKYILAIVDYPGGGRYEYHVLDAQSGKRTFPILGSDEYPQYTGRLVEIAADSSILFFTQGSFQLSYFQGDKAIGTRDFIESLTGMKLINQSVTYSHSYQLKLPKESNSPWFSRIKEMIDTSKSEMATKKTTQTETVKSLLISDHKELGSATLLLIGSGEKKLIQDNLKFFDINFHTWEAISPLRVAATKPANSDITNILLKAGAKVDIKDDYGYTVLMYACQIDGNLKNIKLLVEAGSNIHHLAGRTSVLDNAIFYNQGDYVKYLLSQGAKASSRSFKLARKKPEILQLLQQNKK